MLMNNEKKYDLKIACNKDFYYMEEINWVFLSVPFDWKLFFWEDRP